ncbi:MAG: hypothetical protein U0326_22440 [Polyangiales bacterium]
METIGALIVGLAAGWAARAGMDSKREVAVRAIAAAYALRDRTRRFVAVERENLDDLMAEGRARYDSARARAARNAAANRATDANETDRAA